MRLVLSAMLSCVALTASASEFEHVAPVAHEPTRKECGECHMVFQPEHLPARSWNTIMGGLGDHFGEDASLPESIAGEIRDYLTSRAGRGDGSLLRVTEQRWWLREHRKIRATNWSNPEVKTKVNCPACHRRAEQGDYDDD